MELFAVQQMLQHYATAMQETMLAMHRRLAPMRLLQCARCTDTLLVLCSLLLLFGCIHYSYNARVAILLPTAGERLDVFMLALLGCVSQRIWACGKRTKVSATTFWSPSNGAYSNTFSCIL